MATLSTSTGYRQGNELKSLREAFFSGSTVSTLEVRRKLTQLLIDINNTSVGQVLSSTYDV